MRRYVPEYCACGMRHIATKGEVVELLEFTHFSRVFKFNKTSEIGRKKEIFHEIKVSVVMELVWVDTKIYSSQIQNLLSTIKY